MVPISLPYGRTWLVILLGLIVGPVQCHVSKVYMSVPDSHSVFGSIRINKNTTLYVITNSIRRNHDI